MSKEILLKIKKIINEENKLDLAIYNLVYKKDSKSNVKKLNLKK